MNSLDQIQKRLQGLRGILDDTQTSLDRNKEKVSECSLNAENHGLALNRIQNVVKQTQNELKCRICPIVTSALESVFPDSYEFKMDFHLKRHKSEAELYILKNGKKVDLLTGSGGGVVDISAFALRVACFRLKSKETTRPVFILDESFRFVSKDLQDRAGLIMSTLAEKFNLQFILVTHENSLLEYTDNVIAI